MEREICIIRIGRKQQGEWRCYGRVGARLVADLVQRCPEFARWFVWVGKWKQRAQGFRIAARESRSDLLARTISTTTRGEGRSGAASRRRNAGKCDSTVYGATANRSRSTGIRIRGSAHGTFASCCKLQQWIVRRKQILTKILINYN